MQDTVVESREDGVASPGAATSGGGSGGGAGRLRKCALCLGLLVVAVAAAVPLATRIPDPPAYDPGPLPTLEKNTVLTTAPHLFDGLLHGPESFAVDSRDGSILSGTHDGRIVRLRLDASGGAAAEVETVARTGSVLEGCGAEEHEHECGRPLGMREDPEQPGALYFTDAYAGLRYMSPDGSLSTLCSADDHPSLRLPNDVAIDPVTGLVYFSNTHDEFQRREISLAALESAPRGSVWAYDPRAGTCERLVGGIVMANGIEVAEGGDALLVSSTSRCQVLRYGLRGAGAGELSVFADHLPALPDNIRASPRGTLWVGGSSKRSKPFSLPHSLAGKPFLRSLAGMLPPSIIYKMVPLYGLVLELDASGKLLRTLQDPTGRSPWLSEVHEVQRRGQPANQLLIGSFRNTFITSHLDDTQEQGQ